MLGTLKSERTVVRRLRVRGGAGVRDAGSRIAQALAASTLRPATFPPSAILCVRRLVDPAPGHLVRHLAVRPSPEWELAVRDRLTQLWRDAARPALGPVPSNAEAVWFADSAELLACLAADWRDGRLRTHWWWDGADLTPPLGSAAASLLRVWVEHADALPAALAHLAGSGRAVSVVAALTEAEARAIAGAIAARFGVRLPSNSGTSVPIEPLTTPASGDRLEQRASATDGAVSEPSWAAVVREAHDPAIGPEQRRLLAVALLLHRAPSAVRASHFASSLVAWERTIEPGARAASTERSSVSAPMGARGTDQPAASARSRDHSDENRPAVVHAEPATAVDAVDSRSSEPATLGPIQSGAAYPNEVFEPATVVQTSYGGVLYLVNVALALGLYGDFTTPAHANLALPLWDFLAIAGGHLVGDRFEADPLAALLARLADRHTNEHPGARFEADDEWRVPPGWLEPFAQQEGSEWSSRRLTPVDRWTQRLMPYIEARLRRALGTKEGDDVGRIVCAHDARIHVSALRVDVYLELADLPIAVRLAGLDRDPGWVPSVGRTITFHYE